MNRISTFNDWFGGFLQRLAWLSVEMALFLGVIIIALLVGWVVRRILAAVLTTLRFNALADSAGITAATRRAGLEGTASQYVARMVGWLAVFTVILAGAASIRIPGTTALVDRAFAFIPALVAAFVLLVIGVVLAEFLARGALIAAVNANWRPARLISMMVRFLVLALTVAMALEQIGVAPNVVVATFSIVFGGITLALALAFGLGGRDIAREYLRRRFPPPPSERAGSEIDHL